MHWSNVAVAFGWVALGCALRTLVPWLLASMAKWQEEGGWDILPFESKYVANLVTALIGYGILLATQEGVATTWAQMEPIPLIIIGYGGNEGAREVLKFFFRRLR